MHPDKVADRIAGAIVDMAYTYTNPKIAVEVLIGHRRCFIIIESSVNFGDFSLQQRVHSAVERISGRNDFEEIQIVYHQQDAELAKNQEKGIHVGDNGIFKGIPTSDEEKLLSVMAKGIYAANPTDGKYILDNVAKKIIICQSQDKDLSMTKIHGYKTIVNPLGPWTGGIDVDTGATNRKLGSDMGRGVTGGGLHGKDLSKADVSVNIYAYLKAQELGEPVEISLAIGDDTVDGRPYSEIVKIAYDYIKRIGGFEKFAEWGLI